MSTDQKIAALRAERCRQAGVLFDMHLEAGESPIERLVLAQLMVEGWGHPTEADLAIARRRLPNFGVTHLRTILSTGNSGMPHLAVVQAVVSLKRAPTIRADILFIEPSVDTGKVLVVELDGHDFHQRTKEQARRDRQRDRTLLARGWRTARFTGSEVWADPSRVTKDIGMLLLGRELLS